MKALLLNCSLKATPDESNTEVLAGVLVQELLTHGIRTESIRVADLNLVPGVSTDMGEGDDWPSIHSKLLDSEILIFATPTWLGHPSSIAQRVLERMDAMISETAENGLPVAYNRVAGMVVTGNEDGAHQVISHVAQGLIDIGYTVPGQAWTYWNRGPGPGPSYLETTEGHEWSETTGRTAAGVLVAVAKALQANPIPPEAYQA
ncbi:MAG TPA: flavodoxin family protein [Actinomycetota bacterium]|nr:flavodoxin family protein [Actinomycetota bacterium]